MRVTFEESVERTSVKTVRKQKITFDMIVDGNVTINIEK